MPSAVMTFTSLVEDIGTYSERSTETVFTAQVPRLIMLAEQQLASEWRGLGNQEWVTGTFQANQPVVEKPAQWRETVAWNYGTGVDNQDRNYLLERSLEYCRTYWPNPTSALLDKPPKYYANYDWNHFFVSPTPFAAYPFELGYYTRITPLDEDHQTNWLTEHAPQLLLSACMLQAQPFLKWFGDRLEAWKSIYVAQAGALSLEARNQTLDRSTVVDKT